MNTFSNDFPPLEVFTWYFEHGRNRTKTLRHFHRLNGHESQATINSRWNNYRLDHMDDYQLAKDTYLEDVEIDTVSELLILKDLSLNSQSEQVRLQATKILLDFATKNTRDDYTITQGLKSIQVNFVEPLLEEVSN